MARVHVSPGLSAIEWDFAFGTIGIMVLTSCHAGLEGIAATQEINETRALHRCVDNANTLHPEWAGCLTIARRVVTEADSAEQGVGK